MRLKDSGPVRLLHVAAYIVIVAWGIRSVSDILSVVLISLLLAYALVPVPKWLMKRFRLRKLSAIVLTVCFVVALYLVVSVALVEASYQMKAKLPIYEAHLRSMYEQIVAVLGAHGIQSASLSYKSFYNSDKIMSLMEALLPKVIGFFSDRVLVATLSVIFLIEIADREGIGSGPLSRRLLYYGRDVQRFIAISAQTGAVTALANLVLLIALRVDFAIIWCVLFFYLHFIPNIGFLIAIIPPILVALLTFGWKRAVFVAIGLVITELIADSVLQPVLMRKGLDISFLQTTLSLLIWGFLLGPAGAVLGVPLTIAIKKYLQDPLVEREIAAELAPG